MIQNYVGKSNLVEKKVKNCSIIQIIKKKRQVKFTVYKCRVKTSFPECMTMFIHIHSDEL